MWEEGAPFLRAPGIPKYFPSEIMFWKYNVTYNCEMVLQF